MQETHTDEGLKREIGITDVAINVVNNVIGGGIFLLPAIVAATLGNAAILAYLVCALMVFLVMLCFAENGSRTTTSGGAYVYVESAFGPLAGFIVNSLFWFGSGVISDAALANGLADLLSNPFPALLLPVCRGLLFFLIFGGLAWMNVRGVKDGVNVVRFNTAIKLVPLVLLVAFGLFKLTPANLSWNEWPSIKSLGEASLVLFFAFQGSEAAMNLGGEMKNPKRTAPVGLLFGIGMVAIFYILIQVVAQGVLGTDLPNHKDAPLAAVAEKLIGPVGATMIIAGAALSIFGNLSSSPLLQPRLIFAASKDKLLPKFLSAVHPKFSTPYWAIIAYAVASFVVAISGGFRQLAVISSAAMLLIYLGVVFATIRLRIKGVVKVPGSFRIPLGLTVPVLATIVIFWFLGHLTSQEFFGIAIFLLFLTITYLIRKEINERAARKNENTESK